MRECSCRSRRARSPPRTARRPAVPDARLIPSNEHRRADRRRCLIDHPLPRRTAPSKRRASNRSIPPSRRWTKSRSKMRRSSNKRRRPLRPWPNRPNRCVRRSRCSSSGQPDAATRARARAAPTPRARVPPRVLVAFAFAFLWRMQHIAAMMRTCLVRIRSANETPLYRGYFTVALTAFHARIYH